MNIIGNTARMLINTAVTVELASYLVEVIESLENYEEVEDIEVIINSPGGSVVAGYSIYSALIRSSKTVTTVIDGVAASIAGIIFMSGKIRKAYSHSLFMAHNPSGGSRKILKKIKDSLMTILDGEGFTSAELSGEIWLNVEQMKKREILDFEIEVSRGEAVEVQASIEDLYQVCNKLNLEKYKNMETKNEEIVDEAVVETVDEKEKETVNEENVEATVKETVEETPSIEKEEEEVEAEVETPKVETETLEEVEAKIEVEAKNIVELTALNVELTETNNILSGKVAELENKIAEMDAEKEKAKKVDYLESKNITVTDTWLNLDLSIIEELTKTVNAKSPEVDFGKGEELKMSDLSTEERIELNNSNPELYSKIFFENK